MYATISVILLQVAAMTLSDFAGVSAGTEGSEVETGLSQMERGLLKSLSRVELRGQNASGVRPVLLTQSTKEAVQLLVDKRREGNVAKGNTFVFACNDWVSSF